METKIKIRIVKRRSPFDRQSTLKTLWGVNTLSLYRRYGITRGFTQWYTPYYKYFKHSSVLLFKRIRHYFFKIFLQNKSLFIQTRPNYTYVDSVFMNEVNFFKQFYSQELYYYIMITKSFLKNNIMVDKIKPCAGSNMFLFPINNEFYFDNNKTLEASLINMFKGTVTLKSVLEVNSVVRYDYNVNLFDVVFDIYLLQLLEFYKHFIYLNIVINKYI